MEIDEDVFKNLKDKVENHEFIIYNLEDTVEKLKNEMSDLSNRIVNLEDMD